LNICDGSLSINWKLIQEKGDQEYWMSRMEELYYELLKKRRGTCSGFAN